ncbi:MULTISPECIES: gliding motility protein GldL [Tenacibaculum]|uniref:Gliding motility protein GldL n=3 Tax=Tenacibaculum TaxID=104267 RepID=A0AAE9SG36_9FLAO|nr:MULTISPECIES: gliding motility protein GldL [Tenacibaculum]GFD75561.1 gliding motility protein GldL [Tenacibaculum sp. KUL113]GFD81202.1 gliding motility protein GldL [Tenacibaculum sp. KUL118]GFD94896.1 gliding motility protein GldL [Alteromonas sp. KUL154]GFE00430.1 gliding motility protein GldL [Alteromonas sp. KUL156]AZJ33614.1 gliding motility protein GldL [Tenacibaculum mesophilum]
MAQSKSTKKMFNMAYGLGAAVVIIGALFKILHWPFGNEVLMVGMIVEAAVFALSAFEAVEDDLDWTKVYPELADGQSSGNKRDKKVSASPEEAQSMLSQKLDNILSEAKLDAQLVSRLGDSIKSFQGAVEPLASASQSISATNSYNEQMSRAAAQMESLNSLYQTQVENASKQADLNSAMVENSQRLQEQMQSLATNLSSLNGVYGGMLTAMSNK